MRLNRCRRRSKAPVKAGARDVVLICRLIGPVAIPLMVNDLEAASRVGSKRHRHNPKHGRRADAQRSAPTPSQGKGRTSLCFGTLSFFCNYSLQLQLQIFERGRETNCPNTGAAVPPESIIDLEVKGEGAGVFKGIPMRYLGAYEGRPLASRSHSARPLDL